MYALSLPLDLCLPLPAGGRGPRGSARCAQPAADPAGKDPAGFAGGHAVPTGFP
jgi:hypothetical protein